MATPDREALSPSESVAQSSFSNDTVTASEQLRASTQFLPPFSGSEQSPVGIDIQQDPILSQMQSNLHPLPAKPFNNSASQSTMIQPLPAQPKPRIVGGFEVDDDPEDEEEAQDEKDEADVYDPSVGLDFDVPTPADTSSNQILNSLDRTSQSPEQEIGITPAPVQATGSPADADLSSPTPALGASTDLHAPRAATAAPSHTVPDLPTQTSPPRPHVNGSLAPGLPKSRLAHDVVGILEDRIKDDPRGDTDAYLELIDEFKTRNKQEEVRRVYEDYIKIFPFAVRTLLFPFYSTSLTGGRRINGAPT
jgi:cleavage stimulation factor subunit 3